MCKNSENPIQEEGSKKHKQGSKPSATSQKVNLCLHAYQQIKPTVMDPGCQGDTEPSDLICAYKGSYGLEIN